jgi:hypothetical protein
MHPDVMGRKCRGKPVQEQGKIAAIAIDNEGGAP